MPYLLGIDGGQTSTTTALARPDGTVVCRGVGGPQDHLGASGGRDLLRASLQAALTGLPAEVDIAAATAGMTNVDHPDPRTALIAEVIAEIAPADRIEVVSDRVTCWAGASGGRPSAVLIAGGGSIAYGENAHGETAYCGGWGYLLDDEGSATRVGLHAISAALRAADGRAGPTVLVEVVRREFGVSDFVALKQLVYEASFSRARFGALAPLVVAAARDGDATAGAIVAQAATALAELGATLVDRLFGRAEPADLFLVGGMFGAGEVLLDPLRTALTAGRPALRIRPAAHAPLLGALVLAARATGIAVDAAWLDRARTTLDSTRPHLA